MARRRTSAHPRRGAGLRRWARSFSALTLALMLWVGWLWVAPLLPGPPVETRQVVVAPKALPPQITPSAAPSTPPQGPGWGDSLREWLRDFGGARTPVVPPVVSPIARPEAPQAPLTGQIDRILIEKSARRMTVYRGGEALKSYRIDLGFAPSGHKQKQGDGRTPEGVYRVDRRNDRSSYHLSIGIDYPRAEDRRRARAAGVDPGGDIFIHGAPNAQPKGTRLAADWTAGCVAITNPEIEELFRATPIGAEVEIRP